MTEEASAAAKKKNSYVNIGFWTFVTLAFIIGLIVWLVTIHYTRRTNDAYVEGNPLIITPLVDGFVTSVQTDDTFLVDKNQTLVTLDQINYKIALNEAKANLASAVREVCKIYHQTFAYQSEIDVRFAQFIKAEEFYNHRAAVLDTGAISLEDLQVAKENLGTSSNNFEQAKSLYLKESSLIQGKSIRNNPIITAAVDQLTQAWVNLNRCSIKSPERGIVAQRSAHLGKWVAAGDPLLTVIPMDQIWVNANFKETQMRHIKIGQTVKVYSDMYGKRVIYRGTIVGLPGGAGNAFSILPPQNLSGNWIKIVQRLPVRVAIDPDDLIKHPLRLGMTMHAIVNIRSHNKGYLPKENDLAPIYQTNIYEAETKGAKKFADSIFDRNFDKTLSYYINNPFEPVSFENCP